MGELEELAKKEAFNLIEEFAKKHPDYPLCDPINSHMMGRACAIVHAKKVIEGYEFDSIYLNDRRIIDKINFWDKVLEILQK